MAKVVGPLHSEEARGAVGSLVYNSWRGISTVRSRVAPVTQYTDRQLALRACSATATLAWQTLDQSERDAWNLFAQQNQDIDWTGNPKRLSGFNWFIRCNSRLLDIGEDLRESPPTYPNRFPIDGFEVFPDNGSWVAFWVTYQYPGYDSAWADIWKCGPHSDGLHPTIKEATHEVYVPYGDQFAYWADGGAGTSSFFARSITGQGMASPWFPYRHVA